MLVETPRSLAIDSTPQDDAAGLGPGAAPTSTRAADDGLLVAFEGHVRVPHATFPGMTRIAGRARVAKDPRPRQYCVKQGWLSRAGAIAICAPNQISLSLEGGKTHFDSVSY